jgi:hypothetical protein
MVQSELPRMLKINTNIRLTSFAFAALAAVGLSLHYLVTTDWARGLGAVLILAGAIGLLIDGFAEWRALPYTQVLELIAEEHGGPTSRP